MQNIPVHIGAKELLDTLWLVLSVKWSKESQGFTLGVTHDLELYDKNYARLRPQVPPYPDIDCISAYFFSKGTAKNKTPKFKTGTTTVYLVITQDTYEAFQAHLDALHSPKTGTDVSNSARSSH